MFKAIKIFFCIISATIASNSYATLLTFDDVTAPDTVGTLSSEYNGFLFNQTLDVVDIDPTGVNFWGSTGPAVSGDFAVLNNYGGDGIITAASGGLFSFQSLFIKSWFGSGDNQVMSIDGLVGGAIVGSVSFTQSSTWTQITGNFDAIDSLRINNVGIFLIDNVLLNEPTANVSAPHPLFLLSIGLIGIAASRRKKTA